VCSHLREVALSISSAEKKELLRKKRVKVKIQRKKNYLWATIFYCAHIVCYKTATVRQEMQIFLFIFCAIITRQFKAITFFFALSINETLISKCHEIYITVTTQMQLEMERKCKFRKFHRTLDQ
jgi:hypothetical protein